MQATKNKIVDILFSISYVILFPLQMLPVLVAFLAGTASVVFWIACGIGLIAMITQSINFPCFGARIWSLANVAATIVTVVFVNMGG